MPMWSHRVCDVLAVAVSGQLEKRTNIYIFFVCFLLWCNVNPPMVNGFAKEKKTSIQLFILFPPSLPYSLAKQVVYCTIMRFLWCKRLTLCLFFSIIICCCIGFTLSNQLIYIKFIYQRKNIIETLVCPKTV